MKQKSREKGKSGREALPSDEKRGKRDPALRHTAQKESLFEKWSAIPVHSFSEVGQIWSYLAYSEDSLSLASP